MKESRLDIEYENCSAEEFLLDDFFISSITHPTKETEIFWKNAVKEGKINISEYWLARNFIDSVQAQPETISVKEKFALWEEIELSNKNVLKKRARRYRRYFLSMTGIAAAFLVLLIMKGNFTEKTSEQPEIAVSIENVKPPEIQGNGIQLVIADGKVISVDEKSAEITYNDETVTIEDRKFAVKDASCDVDKSVAFNQLIVPNGTRSTLTLADGSKLWVNAGSRVVYPPVFSADTREIYVDGEVFLDVVCDTDRPFIVKTQKLKMEVLGTSFNVNTYEKENLQEIVLVSGSVKIHAGKQETILLPNQMYSQHDDISELKTVNVENYISWKSGIYQYNSEPLGVILKRISRYYGQKIECTPQASQLICSGKLDLKGDLRQVLDGISQTAPIRCKYENERFYVTNR